MSAPERRVEGDQRTGVPSAAEAASRPLLRTEPLTHESFSAHFDRCFRRVYAYVSRRVDARDRCERIVSDVLAASLDLLANRGDETHEIRQLKATSDRLIARETAMSRSSVTIKA